jgi:uncharacterized hydrophobic protein (TIGR00271 family)
MNAHAESGTYRILVAAGEAAHLAVLLALAAPLARQRGGRVTPVYVGAADDLPEWLGVPADCSDVTDAPVVLESSRAGQAVLAYAHEVDPDLLLLHWRGEPSRGRYLLGRTLDPLIQYAPCDVAVLHVNEPPDVFVERMRGPNRVLIPFGGGPNAGLAARIALDLSQDTQVTALRVASLHLGSTAVSAEWAILRSLIEDTPEPERLEPRVIHAASVVEGIAREAEDDFDLVLVGATDESFVDRMLFGNTPQALARAVRAPLLIVRRRGALPAEAVRRLRWRLINVMTQLSESERIQVYRQVRRAARVDRDYVIMMTLAAGIASLGLLLDSTAVIIGAMLVAPLMSALIGIGMGIVQGDAPLLRLSTRTMAIGALIAIGVSALMELIAPTYNPTGQMLARTSPTLLDLGVALISGAAAAYASAREDVASALPGVAIAVALAPPLVTLGLLATAARWTLALGALLLFLTNLVGIVAAAALVYLWMGFRPNIVEKARARAFRGGVAATVILGIVVIGALGFLSMNALRGASVRRQVAQVLESRDQLLGANAQVADWEVDIGPELTVMVSIETTEDITTAQALDLQLALTEKLGQPTTLQVTVIPVRRIVPSLISEQ